MSRITGHIKRISGSILSMIILLVFLAITITGIIYLWNLAPRIGGVPFGNLPLNIIVKFIFIWGIIIILAMIVIGIIYEMKRSFDRFLGMRKTDDTTK